MKLKPKMPEQCCPGHNRNRIEIAAVASLRIRAEDPKRFKPREIEIASAVLEKLPPGAPLPVIVNDKGEVLLGHIFVEAARKRGVEWIVVTRHKGMSEIEEKQFVVSINELLAKGSWDPAGLETWIREFEASIEDFSHLSLGFDNGELDRILGVGTRIAGLGGDADDVPPRQAVAVSRRGMIWQAGRHLIMCGSATDTQDFLRLLAGHLAVMTITDPPFGCKIDGFVSMKGKHADFLEGAGEKSPEELEEFFIGLA